MFVADRMGKAQSKDSSAKVPDETDHARPKKQLVEVEEVFVQKIAYKCGVTEEELSAKKEVFRHVTSCNCTHVQSITGFCSGSTPVAPRPSASTSSRTCTGTSAAARRTSSSTSTSSRYSGQEIFCRERHFINILVRAFDTNKDDLLTFREWQVGFYLLLLLPSVKFFFELLIISFLSFPQEKHTDVSKEDFLLALEVSQTSLTKNILTNISCSQIIFRLYDEDSNNRVTKQEVRRISSIITQPEFAAKFDSGVITIIREIDSADLDK